MHKAMSACKMTDYPMFAVYCRGRSDGAMVLVNFQCRGVLLILIILGQGPTVLAVGADGNFWISLLSIISLFFPSL